MASGSVPHLPAFDDIIKRGSATEPRKSRPTPNLLRDSTPTGQLSLNAAVQANKSAKASNSAKVKKSKKKLNGEESGSERDHRKRTPMTMPRTKITPATPLEQRIGLNMLKQKLDFNAKKNVAGKETQKTTSVEPSSVVDDNFNQIPFDLASISSVAQSELSEINVNKMNERLDQVREYLKQATSMYVSLSIAGSDDPKRGEQMSKLAKLIQQLRVQEQGYLDLFQRTMIMNEENTDTASIISIDQSEISLADNSKIEQLNTQQSEIERLREQQALLKKIVDQQKELQQLKEKQTTLLEMQENAEQLIQHQQTLNNVPNNQRNMRLKEEKQNNAKSAKMNDQLLQQQSEDATMLLHADAAQKRLELENKLLSLQIKKDQMDKTMQTLKSLKDAQKDAQANMSSGLNQDDLNDLASELASSITSVANSNEDLHKKVENMSIDEKITQLNDVRKRLHDLRGIVAEYESNIPQESTSTDSIRDNRLHAQAILQKEGDTVTGVGGARLRIPNTTNQQKNNLFRNDFNALDNRNRPAPKKTQIDVTRNPPSPKHKNTNQEKKVMSDMKDLEALLSELPLEYRQKVKEIQLMKQQIQDQTINYQQQLLTNENETSGNTSETHTEDTIETASERDSDIESDNSSSALQWQDDPEFHNKVKKLQMAKEKLHHLQQLVKVVQQGGGPHLPVDDLENLTLTFSDQNDVSEFGESEEEAENDNEEGTCEEQTDDEQADGEQTEEEGDDKSEISKSTDLYYNYAPENGLSDNERRYQGLLRKQRLELNYLLKERERLLEAQQKLSVMGDQENDDEILTDKKTSISFSAQKKEKKSKKSSNYPALTKKELNKQKFKKTNDKQNFLSKLNGMDADAPFTDYGYPNTVELGNQSEDKVPVTAQLKNPLAVSEIRRQRDLFEQKKKQKVLEKQQRKKNRNRGGEGENQSDDRATYSVHSDIDEGVGISMHSADVTTAATWGGSTEQSSSEDDDSAVGESYAATGEMANCDEDDDVYGSQFDQAEEEEENAHGVNNLPPIFKVKKYENSRPRRGISWHQNDVTPGKKRKLTEKKSDASQGNGSVTWSLDVSPPRSRRKPRQGNLTPAHKLIQDQHKKRVSKLKHEQLHHQPQQPALKTDIEFPTSTAGVVNPSDQLHTQLANMCTSLLRNEQTLLSMLQSQASKPNRVFTDDPIHTNYNNSAYNNIQEYFETSNYAEGFQNTMGYLKKCYERMEQHQQDMHYMHQQFSMLQTSDTNPTSDDLELKSPWPNPPSLHMSSLTNENDEFVKTQQNNSVFSAKNMATSIPNSLKPKKLSYQKETQTETTLFEDPFKPPSIQPYTLFGQASRNPSLQSPGKKDSSDFVFEPVLDPISPGAIGDRSFNHAYDIQSSNDAAMEIDNVRFPYRLRMSEYNPLSYQGNFANTSTGNVITMSRMSMSKDHAETNVTNRAERIWPSFFKLNGTAVVLDINQDYVLETSAEPATKNTNKVTHSSVVERTEHQATSSGESNFSLFEALRDSIYSEVATLIAMNESRPHYLIELFRELQLLNSDYLRQRALYSLQELVTRFLTDESSSPSKRAFTQETLQQQKVDKQSGPSYVHSLSKQSGPPFKQTNRLYEQWMETASEQTPSESVMTTDDEGEAQALKSLARQIQNNEMYDYAEPVDSQSDCNISTAGSQSENPFAAEDLGNTVINLDEALRKMRKYEESMTEAKKAFELISNDVHESTPSNVVEFTENRKKAAFDAIKRRMSNQTDTASNASTGDVGSETSSDMPQPSVDTQKLDQQIKAVMVDLIPFLNENINCICTDQLLDQIRNLILHFAKQKEPESEKEQFGRFFHSQLDSILRDSLMKFNGRSLKECGEDVLIDVSEILFNELAFFKLMQDLDRPLYSEAVGGLPAQDKDSIRQKSKMPFVENKNIENDIQSACQSIEMINLAPVEMLFSTQPKESNSNSISSTSSSNAFVMIDPATIETFEETESSRQFVKVELSQSESRPVRSSGSGEEDNEEELAVFAQQQAPPSSMLAYSHSNEAANASGYNQNEAAEDDGDNFTQGNEGREDDRDESNQSEHEDERSEHERVEGEQHQVAAVQVENENAEDQRDLDGVVEDENVEGEGQIHNVDVDDDDRPEDDLPEADMVSDNNMAAEAAQVVLQHLEGQQEIVGDNDVLPPQ